LEVLLLYNPMVKTVQRQD